MTDRTYDNSTTFEEMMAWHREDRPSCPSEVVVMARVGYGCEMCGWSVEEASLRLKDRSHPQPCDHWSPHPKDGFCVACGWAQVVHDIGSPSDHFRNGRRKVFVAASPPVTAEDRVVPLMDALDRSVRNAKADRKGPMTETTLPPVIDDQASKDLRQAGKQVQVWTAKRDELIKAAVAAGGSLREVGEAVGLSHTAVRFIAHGRPST